MSGEHFDYQQSQIRDIAYKIEAYINLFKRGGTK